MFRLVLLKNGTLCRLLYIRRNFLPYGIGETLNHDLSQSNKQ
ncbi:hypothetical protein MuYL_0207 [Mucilaginibacter xinganensis]|uniref:Uncharacterized protein n=1 Tax=Mucilaginibacter xinganensis TaxID=1234841 RepID=A0A223NQS8_9SPHI|nr:hypothetical protein MuYL_0207 [Mucilaginibacter xinganensis]